MGWLMLGATSAGRRPLRGSSLRGIGSGTEGPVLEGGATGRALPVSLLMTGRDGTGNAEERDRGDRSRAVRVGVVKSDALSDVPRRGQPCCTPC